MLSSPYFLLPEKDSTSVYAGDLGPPVRAEKGAGEKQPPSQHPWPGGCGGSGLKVAMACVPSTPQICDTEGQWPSLTRSPCADLGLRSWLAPGSPCESANYLIPFKSPFFLRALTLQSLDLRGDTGIRCDAPLVASPIPTRPAFTRFSRGITGLLSALANPERNSALQLHLSRTARQPGLLAVGMRGVQTCPRRRGGRGV